MNNEVFVVTHEIMKLLMDNKRIKVGQVSVEPLNDPTAPIDKTMVRINFVVYDKDIPDKKTAGVPASRGG